MRCFIAIDLDETLKADLVDLQEQIQREVDLPWGVCKWVKPDAIHLTLNFLGDIGDTQSVEVCRIARAVCARHQRFSIHLAGMGHFGGRSARVLWLGMVSPSLLALQSDLAEELDRAGWPKEAKRFTGHLTLCRIRNTQAGFELAKAGHKYENVDLGMLPVETVTVYQSQLQSDGPQYTVLGRYEL
jgi:RNA 2',3'-cyclic 3'-phosphodiesterase